MHDGRKGQEKLRRGGKGERRRGGQEDRRARLGGGIDE